MQIIDCQFGTLIIPIIIKILAPTKEKACALHAKTVIWEWNGSLCLKVKRKRKQVGHYVLYSKEKWNKCYSQKEETRRGRQGVAFTF